MKVEVTKQKPIDTAALAEKAQNSKEKEAYIQLEKTPAYRIGVGARANHQPPLSFFLEVVIALSGQGGEVDLQLMENVLQCLKALKARGYTLTYEDGNSISCESEPLEKPDAERREIEKLLKAANLTNP